MPPVSEAMTRRARRVGAPVLAPVLVVAATVCGCGAHDARTRAVPAPPPGAGKPPVTIGDKNFTEQFVLGQLYRQALVAKGYTVQLNPNIGPLEVTLQALASGRLDMYPEYLDVWDRAVARHRRVYATRAAAYRAARRYARSRGFALLQPTPFSDTDAIVVGVNFAAEKHLDTIADLRKVADSLTIGGPVQFAHDPNGLPALEQTYALALAAFKPLAIGAEYQALDQGLAQAIDANTTDGQLLSGNYTMLRDTRRVFGWGNVVPVVSAQTMRAEGPAFAATINAVSSLLTLDVIRELNAAVDLGHQEPAQVARRFLLAHGLVPAAGG